MRAVAVTPARAARRAGIALGLLWLVLPAAAAAQSAWVPLKGEGAISLVFQNLEFGGHFDEHGTKLDGAVPSRAYIGIFHFEYALTDKVAVTARLPYVASKFTGHDHEPVTAFLREQYEEFQRTHPEATGSSLDTGEFYSTFQDFNFTLRYNAINRGGVMVTPVIGLTIPSHRYRTIGEAAPGQDRRALHVGANIGRLLDPVLPNAYLHGRYTYSFVEDLLGINLDRSAAEFEVGYAITSIISARALVSWARTHGGIPFSRSLQDPFLFLAHDRLLAVRYWHVGAGTTVSLTDAIDLDGAVVTFLSGADTHYGLGISVGLTWRVLSAALPQP
jgi:hypothetical protein